MKRILFILTFIFLISLSLVSFVNAASIYKIGDPVNLKVSCKNNGTLCSNSAMCNLTIFYEPTGENIIKDVEMTNSYSYFNYTIPPRSEIGIYKGTMYCIDNGMGGMTPISYELTSTGDTRNWLIFLILGIFSVVLLIVGLYSGNEYVLFIAGGAITITGVYSVIYGVGNVMNVYTRILGLITIAIGLLFLIVSSLKAIAEVSGDGNDRDGIGSIGGNDYDYYNEE
jgi:hypothetical protein